MELVLKGRRAFWWRVGAGASAPVPRSRTLPPARRCSRSDGASMACTRGDSSSGRSPAAHSHPPPWPRRDARPLQMDVGFQANQNFTLEIGTAVPEPSTLGDDGARLRPARPRRLSQDTRRFGVSKAGCLSRSTPTAFRSRSCASKPASCSTVETPLIKDNRIVINAYQKGGGLGACQVLGRSVLLGCGWSVERTISQCCEELGRAARRP
jgi:hypothetical protein